MAASNASTTAPSPTKVTPRASPSGPTERSPDRQLTQKQSTPPPGWGFLPTTESARHKAAPKHRMNFQEQSCSSLPIPHMFWKDCYGSLVSIETFKRGILFVPSYVASECAGGTVWSRAQRVLRWQRHERHAARLPTQPKRELYGARRAVYPHQLCSLVQMSFNGTPMPENHDAGTETQPAPDIESRLHNEQASDAKSFLGVPEATAWEMLAEGVDELPEKTWDTIQESPELRCQSIKITSEPSSMPEEPLGESEQRIEAFEVPSSLQTIENSGQKCAGRCPSPKLLSHKPISQTLPSRKEPGIEMRGASDLCLPSAPLLMHGTESLGELITGKSSCNSTWLPAHKVAEAYTHAAHSSSEIGEQNPYCAKPQDTEVTNLHQEAVENDELLCGSIPLKCFPPTTELGKCDKTSEGIEISQPHASTAVDNEFLKHTAPSKGIRMNDDTEVEISENTKLKVVPPSSTQKHEADDSVKCAYLGGRPTQSPEKKTSDNKGAPSQQWHSPVEESTAQNHLTLSVGGKAPKNNELSKGERALKEGSSTEINLSKSTKTSTEMKASGNKAATTKNEPEPKELSAQIDVPYVKQMAFEGETVSETMNTSNHSTAAGSTNAQMTLPVATTAWGQSFPVRLSEPNEVVCDDATELIQKAHTARRLDVGRWQKVMRRTNEEFIGDGATKSERMATRFRQRMELVISRRTKPGPRYSDRFPDAALIKWEPHSTSPPDQQEPSEAQVYHKATERKQEIEESTACGALQTRVSSIPAATGKLPTAPEKCRGNNQDSSEDSWQRQHSVDLPRDTLAENSGKSCKRHEPSNWDWGIGERLPRETPIRLLSSSRGSGSCKLNGPRRRTYQAEASNSPSDVDLWSSDHHSSPPWAPYSERDGTTRKSHGRQDHFSKPSTSDTLGKIQPSRQASLQSQSAFSYSDSFVALCKHMSNYSTEPAIKDRDRNCPNAYSRTRKSPPELPCSCTCTCKGFPAYVSNEALGSFSGSETRITSCGTLDRKPEPWENLSVSLHPNTGRKAQPTGIPDYFCEPGTCPTSSSFDWQEEVEQSFPLSQHRRLALWERTGTQVDCNRRRNI